MGKVSVGLHGTTCMTCALDRCLGNQGGHVGVQKLYTNVAAAYISSSDYRTNKSRRLRTHSIISLKVGPITYFQCTYGLKRSNLQLTTKNGRKLYDDVTCKPPSYNSIFKGIFGSAGGTAVCLFFCFFLMAQEQSIRNHDLGEQ